MEKYRVLIATADPEEARALETLLTEDGKFRVLSVVDSGLACMDAMARDYPDLLVLNLLLRDMDGVELLESLMIEKDDPIRVLVVSASACEMNQAALRAGADHCVPLPCRYELVVERCTQLLLFGREELNHQIREETHRIMTELGAPIHMKGYECALAGIVLAYHTPELLRHMTSAFYPAIADALGWKPGNVEKNLRDFIRALFNHGHLEALERYFKQLPHSSAAALTNGIFFTALVSQVRFNLREKQTKKGERGSLSHR